MYSQEVPSQFRSCVSEDGTQVLLANRGLESLPEWLRNLTELTTLDVSANELATLPEWLGNLAALTTLYFDANHLTALPESFGNLTALTRLGLTRNRLTALPESLGNLTSLTALYLNGNQLSALPKTFWNLAALIDLSLDYNQLTTLPESFGNLTTLIRLDLSGDQLGALPESFGNLTALADLSLDRNQLTVLPESFGNLTALTQLSIADNRLTTLPESFGNLTALADLSLDRNQLTVLPESFGNLTALTQLSIADNRLTTTLPESFGNLTALADLSLDRNQLTTLSESLGNLTVLTRLSLIGNQLTRLPRQLAHGLTRGLHLSLTDNPLDDPLPEFVVRGADALAAYLGSLEDAVAQYEAKLLLVGEGNVGKTSLVAALRGAPFVHGRSTTHGIEIWPMKFRHPARGQGMKFDKDMTLRAWDFGGQEVYRVTHQFFFSRRALYLVVWSARDGQEQDEVEGWLRRIRLRAGHDARIIIVATHCEDRLPELDYPQLKHIFQDMLGGSFEVDSRTDLGIPTLREAISQEAAKLPQMGQLISPRWIAARDEILAQSEPQIRYQQFANVCERHGVTGPEIVALAQLMHDLGHIIYYGQDEGLRDIVVLNPEWLTKAISYVLEDKATRQAGGVLDHARLKDIWQDRDDGSAYPASYHPYFLRLMEKFDVSYRLENDELRSLVAQLVPHERPALPWQARTQPPSGIRILALVCRLSEPAPGLIPWLTVRHHHASTGMHWRRGVFLRHPINAYASEALLELHHPTELAVEVRAPSPDLYFNVLRDSIEDLITRRWPGLTYQLFIPCPGRVADKSTCPGQFPLDGLLRLRESGHMTFPCVECAQVHEISLLLTGFTMPTQSLGAELEQLHDQLVRIESGVIRAEGHAADAAVSVRRVLRVVSTEVTDCPRLFTLIAERPTGDRRLRFFESHYRLTLWCEHPGYWHPWIPATYVLDTPKEWFAQVSPYATLIFRTLQLIVPVAGSVADVLLSPDQLAHAQSYLQLMSTAVSELPTKPERDLDALDLGAADRLTASEGQALRALRSVLFEHDKLRRFGGMRRVQAPSGDFLWVCQDHYPEYDPGLPKIP